MNRGSDIRIKVKLTLAEIANGVTKKLKINKTVACDKCGGTGAKDSNSYSTCSTCNGTGYVTRVENTFFGRMQTQGVCPTCGGTGDVYKRQVREQPRRPDRHVGRADGGHRAGLYPEPAIHLRRVQHGACLLYTSNNNYK